MLWGLWLTVASGQGWQSEPVARHGPIRSIGMAVDGASGERFFVLDNLSTRIVQVPQVGPVRATCP